jgi:hypothetical protein
LATKDHFSSNWTSRVLGGKSHEFVVELLGVLAGAKAVADDGVLADAHQAAGLADAAALGEVVQDGEGFFGTQAGVEQGRALAFGEACLAGLAVEQAAWWRSIACADGEIAVASFTVVGTVGVLTAESVEVVVHGFDAGLRKGDNTGHSAEDVVEKGCQAFNTVGTPPTILYFPRLSHSQS